MLPGRDEHVAEDLRLWQRSVLWSFPLQRWPEGERSLRGSGALVAVGRLLLQDNGRGQVNLNETSWAPTQKGLVYRHQTTPPEPFIFSLVISWWRCRHCSSLASLKELQIIDQIFSDKTELAGVFYPNALLWLCCSCIDRPPHWQRVKWPGRRTFCYNFNKPQTCFVKYFKEVFFFFFYDCKPISHYMNMP